MKASELTVDADIDKALKASPPAPRAFGAPPARRGDYPGWIADTTERNGGARADGKA
jgi:hypothetical protein